MSKMEGKCLLMDDGETNTYLIALGLRLLVDDICKISISDDVSTLMPTIKVLQVCM